MNKEYEMRLIIAMEECGELIQSISKHLRYGKNQEGLCEEIADVELSIRWIIEYCKLDPDVLEKWRKYKNERIITRKLYD